MSFVNEGVSNVKDFESCEIGLRVCSEKQGTATATEDVSNVKDFESCEIGLRVCSKKQGTALKTLSLESYVPSRQSDRSLEKGNYGKNPGMF